MSVQKLNGDRCVLERGDGAFPEQLESIPRPPERLYVIGNAGALVSGLAIVGARRSTPYGRTCARRFARIAAEKGIVIISGGARGCDSEAHRAALEAGGLTVVFLGGGCDRIYPSEHRDLFQQIIDQGGAVVSENPWDFNPLPYTFRERNRLIAGLSNAVLIVEAGLPSGTFSTADEALDADREVWAVPGSITAATARGANRLILQGALPIIDDETFEDALFRAFGALKWPHGVAGDATDSAGLPAGSDGAACGEWADTDRQVIEAILAQPLTMDELYGIARDVYEGDEWRSRLTVLLAEAQAGGLIARQIDGRWGPCVVHG